MILGEGIPQITDRINKGIDTARYNAERVARTETKRVTYCAHDGVYKDIVKGKKTINDVPPVIREQVKQILIDLDLPELAE